MSSKRSMPRPHLIIQHWIAKHPTVDQFLEDQCFACGGVILYQKLILVLVVGGVILGRLVV